MSEKQVKNFTFTIEKVGALTALLVPLLYINGYTYDQGYLGVYGVSSEFFHRSIEEYLVFSFYAFFQTGAQIVEYFNKTQGVFAATAASVGGFSLFLGWVYRSGKNEYLSEKRKEIKKSKWFDYVAFPVFSSFLSYVSFNFIFILIAIALTTSTWPYFVGRHNAQKEMNSYKECSVNKVINKQTCIYLYDSEKLLDGGLLVAKSDDYIAIYNGKEVVLHKVGEQKIVIPRNKI